MPEQRQPTLSVVAVLCCVSLIAGVVWSSDRGLGLTDEAYYLLSAIHPEQVQLYISAQHWVLAPLWALTGSLEAFRLVGAVILLGSAGLLAMGATRAMAAVTGYPVPALTTLGVAAASGVGALAYVATIAPSPSYNLLASAGGYGAVGCALLALNRGRWVGLSLAIAAGGWLAVSLINKPSAGVCVGLTVLALVAGLQSGGRKWGIIGAGVLGTVATLGWFAAMQPSAVAIEDSFRGGLDLFRMVQTEPVMERLMRYAVTTAAFVVGAVTAFWPTALLAVALLVYPRNWLAWVLVGAALVGVLLGKHHMAGMTRYVGMVQAHYALLIVTLALGVRYWIGHAQLRWLFAGLLVLPFSIAIGTGNALFTQVIVALAPWTMVAAMLGMVAGQSPALRLAQRGVAALLLVVVTAQVFNSFTREPYHLHAPLIAQTEVVSVGRLGALRVDPFTADFLAQVAGIRQVCGIGPETAYLGIFNLPGLALLLDAVAPVTPWLNNVDQLAAVLKHWQPDPARPTVLALSPEVWRDPAVLPLAIWPPAGQRRLCGKAKLPYDGTEVEFWLVGGRGALN